MLLYCLRILSLSIFFLEFGHLLKSEVEEESYEIGMMTLSLIFRIISYPFSPRQNFGPDQVKEFADDKFNVTNMIISVFVEVENIVGKGEIACTSNFCFCHNVFKRFLSQTRQKVSVCENELNNNRSTFQNEILMLRRKKNTSFYNKTAKFLSSTSNLDCVL